MGGQNNSPLRITIYNKPEEIFRNQNNLNASDIDGSVIKRLIAQSALFCIQICDYIPLEIIALLNDKLFSARKDVEFRIFGFYGKVCDLSFLSLMTEVTKIEISVSEVKNLEVLSELHNLKSLFLNIAKQRDYAFFKNLNKDMEKLAISAGGNVSSFDMDCEWLISFHRLKELYLGKVKKNLPLIREMKSLENLTLRGITCTSMDFLKDIPLKRLAVHWGRMDSFDSLEGHETIEDVELWRISKLDNVNFLRRLPNLKKIHLWQLACIKSLPDFPAESKIECIDIDECRQFENIEAVKGLRNLKKIRLIAAVPEREAAYALENPSIEEILYYCGDAGQRERVNQKILQAGKKCQGSWKY